MLAVLMLTGCTQPNPDPTPTITPSASPTRAATWGAYGDQAAACEAIGNDIITVQRIVGSVELGLDRDGVNAMLREVNTMRFLAPPVLAEVYASLADVVRAAPVVEDSAPTPTPTISPSAGTGGAPSTPVPTPTPTPPAVQDEVEVILDDLRAWMEDHCTREWN